MMRRVILSVLAFALVVPGVVRAQDEELSETYEGDGIRFSYPTGWIVDIDEEGNVSVKNVEFDSDAVTQFPAGVVEVSVGTADLDESDLELLGMSTEHPEYVLGYFAGLFGLAEWFQVAIGGGELASLDMGTPATTEIAGYNAVYVVTSAATETLFILTYSEDEFMAAVTARTPLGEMDQWQNLALAIAQTVEVSDEFVRQETEAVTSVADESEEADEAIEQPVARNDGVFPLEIGTSVSGFMLPGADTVYEFEAEAGSAIGVNLVRTSGNTTPWFLIRRPNGDILYGSSESHSLIEGLPLPDSGTYQVVITTGEFEDEEGSAAFNLSLYETPLPSDLLEPGSEITPGSTGTTFLLPTDEEVSYSFEAEAGDVVTATADTTSGLVAFDMSIIMPDGTLLFEDAGSTSAHIEGLPLPLSGEYRLVLSRTENVTFGENSSAKFSLLLQLQ
jgi:hypothetical protein